MVKQLKRLYRFGAFSLDPEERLFMRDEKQISLTPKVFDLLVLLIENRGHLLEKEDLMRALWQDSFVEESNLAFNISTLRKALSEDSKQRQFIETVPKRGYRFIAEVRIVELEIEKQPEISRQLNTEIAREKVDDQFSGENHTNEIDKANLSGIQTSKPNSGKEPEVQMLSSFATSPREQIQPPTAGNRLPQIAVIIVAFLFTTTFISFGIYKFTNQTSSIDSQNTIPQPMKIVQLTTARNAVNAAISPDGKYVVYVLEEARKKSLWLRQLTTNSDVQLIPPANVNYLEVSFSQDGNYVNFYKVGPEAEPTLYQIPILGGSSRKLIENIYRSALSPDGKQYVFIRNSENGQALISIANASDRSEEQKLISRVQPGFLFNPSWSPDGKSIVCVSGTVTEAGRQVDLIEVRLSDKTERKIASLQGKFIERVVWLPDGKGILMTVSGYSFGPYQIWHISYPDGQIRQVTNDLSNYGDISLASDSRTLVSVQSDIRPFVWVTGSNTEGEKAIQITSSPGTRNDYWGFSWTPDGRIVYVSTVAGSQDIWIMNADGSNQKQLTFGAYSDFDPSVSPDGRYIVFASERSGNTKIWQMDINGENLKQLTQGDTSDYLPSYTRDGRQVIFTSSNTRNQTLWKISLEDGKNVPLQITPFESTWGTVSPDDKLIACWRRDEKTGVVKLSVLSADKGEEVKSFSVSSTAKTWADIYWTADGRALTYIDTIGGIGNIWLQPLEGGSPRQITDFKTERIFRFALSPDGKQLTFSRGIETNDVVLISNFR